MTSAFHGGGVGVRHGAGAIRTGMDIMILVMVILTATVMATVTEATDMATPATVMDTATPDTAMVIATATAATPEWLNYSAGWLALVTIMDPSMASWGLRRDERFVRTNRNTRTRRLIYSLLVTANS